MQSIGFRLKFPTTLTHLRIVGDEVWEDPSIQMPPNLTHLVLPNEDLFHKIPCSIPLSLQEVTYWCPFSSLLKLKVCFNSFCCTKKNGVWTVSTSDGRIVGNRIDLVSLYQGTYMEAFVTPFQVLRSHLRHLGDMRTSHPPQS